MLDFKNWSTLFPAADQEDLEAGEMMICKNLEPRNGKLVKTHGPGVKLDYAMKEASNNKLSMFGTFIHPKLTGTDGFLYINSYIYNNNYVDFHGWDPDEIPPHWVGLENFTQNFAENSPDRGSHWYQKLQRGNPLIFHGDEFRALCGNLGEVGGEPVLPLWCGYIKREFFCEPTGGYSPSENFYTYTAPLVAPAIDITVLETPGGPYNPEGEKRAISSLSTGEDTITIIGEHKSILPGDFIRILENTANNGLYYVTAVVFDTGVTVMHFDISKGADLVNQTNMDGYVLPFSEGEIKWYKFSYIYDGVQESLMTEDPIAVRMDLCDGVLPRFEWTIPDETAHNFRITALVVYRSDTRLGIYNRIQIVDYIRPSDQILSAVNNGAYTGHSCVYVPGLANYSFINNTDYQLLLKVPDGAWQPIDFHWDTGDSKVFFRDKTPTGTECAGKDFWDCAWRLKQGATTKTSEARGACAGENTIIIPNLHATGGEGDAAGGVFYFKNGSECSTANNKGVISAAATNKGGDRTEFTTSKAHELEIGDMVEIYGFDINIPSGSIVEGTVYINHGYTKVTYNSVDYADNEHFTGVAGVATYTTEGTGKVILQASVSYKGIFMILTTNTTTTFIVEAAFSDDIAGNWCAAGRERMIDDNYKAAIHLTKPYKSSVYYSEGWNLMKPHWGLFYATDLVSDNVPSGSIVAGFLYVNVGYTKVTYNGSDYTSGQFFRGVSGVTTYTTEGSGQVKSKTIRYRFYDNGLTAGVPHYLAGEKAIHINGNCAVVVQDILFQGDLILDPGGKNEERPQYISFSEPGKLDVNPVSRIKRINDREGGNVLVQLELEGSLVSITKFGMTTTHIDNPGDPDSWKHVQSKHNLGTIARLGCISVKGVIYTPALDGIYAVRPNNLSPKDQTPLDVLKITDEIENIYMAMSFAQKQAIVAGYDALKSEVLFKFSYHQNGGDPENTTFAYDIVRNSWREIGEADTNIIPGAFFLDEQGNLLVWDEDGGKTYSFSEDASDPRATLRIPYQLISDERKEVVRDVKITYMSASDLKVNVYTEHDEAAFDTFLLPASAKPITYHYMPRTRCMKFALEITEDFPDYLKVATTTFGNSYLIVARHGGEYPNTEIHRIRIWHD